MKYIPPIGGAADDPYVDVNEAVGVEGSYVPAAAVEAPLRELHNLIEALGGVPDPADYAQVANWLLAFFAPIPGSAAQVFRVATAVGASDATPLAQVQSLIAAVSQMVIASAAEAQGQTNNTKALTPLRLAEALQGANQSLGASGYQKLLGGLILQWGLSNNIGIGSSLLVTLPVVFPSAVLCLTCNPANWINADITTTGSWSASAVSASQISINNRSSINPGQFFWLAIGY